MRETAAATVTQVVARLAHKQALVERLTADATLRLRVSALRRWQAQRLADTYQDLRSDGRHRAAIEFFLSDVYGAEHDAPRDRDLRRAWRILEWTLPMAAMDVLADALELEALTLELDCETARALPADAIDGAAYAAAYRAADRDRDRERQITLVVSLARRLADVVRAPVIGRLLRLARAPAHAAGFGALQDFLERGCAAFESLGDATTFIAAIETRERRLRSRLQSGEVEPFADPDMAE